MYSMAVTGSLKAFDHAWAITGGGPGFHSAYLAIYMYKSAFVRSSYGYASAISVTDATCLDYINIYCSKAVSFR